MYVRQNNIRNLKNYMWSEDGKALIMTGHLKPITEKFADDMIPYIQNPKDTIRKLLELTSEFRKSQDTT